ncbi:acetate--CoA ligase [Saitoella complicata NRRL Y-17804]|uniref:acetate--CoA ligase n=1 Tax=Saitoella complicata (strain BCRC 22490 / CBS 7301 / JCM 7358 / NBRC 10748 / NRRL Y-17804) TaxID=698492 RepID=UPI000866CA4D|nr:acetate--CoA ligase [Saitoella complicata NRRL Y-17804]ODQ50758.1 acetate--CoA ligase [Saitoella complicata NRRL Y-17804]
MSAGDSQPVVIESINAQTYHPPKREPHHPEPHVRDIAQYQELYKESIEDPDAFWGKLGRELLDWHTPFTRVTQGSFEHGDIAWYTDGYLNACYNCVDRHALKTPDAPAIIFEADEPSEGRIVSYSELLREVCKCANVLKSLGVKKGDTVAVYLPMIPETLVTLLAIVRIGAIHSVVFAGFSAESLRDRVLDADSRVVITSDEGKRGGKTIGTKRIVDDALKECPDVEHVLIFKRTGNEIPLVPGRDKWWHEEMAKFPSWCPPVMVNAEDPLFLLYTSGSTGKPKGVMHSTAGYLVGAAATTKYVFDVHPGDRMGTAGDVGWITGHTYIVYGPLLLGAATLVFEGTPAYPNFSRYWEIVERHKITQWYVAPTAIRLLKRAGDHHIKHDLSSLRVLGSVGEPIAPDVWHWYYEKVGRGKCAVVDTYWQTETGSHVLTPLPHAIPTKPGSACLPFFGIQPAIVDPVTGEELVGNDVEGVLCFRKPWPSIARTVWGAHERYLDTYMRPYKGFYFTGDGAGRDHEGYLWIRGRVDDVVNVSGHRLSTAEIEAALIHNKAVAEAAVVGVPDELTGQAVMAFICLKSGYENNEAFRRELILQVRKSIGPFAAPKALLVVNDLPKTRSGKIMRRVLRKLHAGEPLGDTSTLQDESVIEHLIEVIQQANICAFTESRWYGDQATVLCPGIAISIQFKVDGDRTSLTFRWRALGLRPEIEPQRHSLQLAVVDREHPSPLDNKRPSRFAAAEAIDQSEYERIHDQFNASFGLGHRIYPAIMPSGALPSFAPSYATPKRRTQSPLDAITSSPRRLWGAVAAILFVIWFLFSGPSVPAAPIPFRGSGPEVVLVLATDTRGHQKPYFSSVLENRKEYARAHGYGFVWKNVGDYDLGGASNDWGKIPVLREAMLEYPEATWFWYLDQDAIIMNPQIPITKHILESSRLNKLLLRDQPIVPPDSIIHTPRNTPAKNMELLITQDHNGLNTGNFLIKRGDWAEYVLDVIMDPLYRFYNGFDRQEQSALEHIVQWHPTILTKLGILAPRSLNSLSDASTDMAYKEGDFVVHLKGCSDSQRNCDKEFLRLWQIRGRLQDTRK